MYLKIKLSEYGRKYDFIFLFSLLSIIELNLIPVLLQFGFSVSPTPPPPALPPARHLLWRTYNE